MYQLISLLQVPAAGYTSSEFVNGGPHFAIHWNPHVGTFAAESDTFEDFFDVWHSQIFSFFAHAPIW